MWCVDWYVCTGIKQVHLQWVCTMSCPTATATIVTGFPCLLDVVGWRMDVTCLSYRYQYRGGIWCFLYVVLVHEDAFRLATSCWSHISFVWFKKVNGCDWGVGGVGGGGGSDQRWTTTTERGFIRMTTYNKYGSIIQNHTDTITYSYLHHDTTASIFRSTDGGVAVVNDEEISQIPDPSSIDGYSYGRTSGRIPKFTWQEPTDCDHHVRCHQAVGEDGIQYESQK